MLSFRVRRGNLVVENTVIPAVAVRRISRTSLQRVRDASTRRNPEKPLDTSFRWYDDTEAVVHLKLTT